MMADSSTPAADRLSETPERLTDEELRKIDRANADRNEALRLDDSIAGPDENFTIELLDQLDEDDRLTRMLAELRASRLREALVRALTRYDWEIVGEIHGPVVRESVYENGDWIAYDDLRAIFGDRS